MVLKIHSHTVSHEFFSMATLKEAGLGLGITLLNAALLSNFEAGESYSNKLIKVTSQVLPPFLTMALISGRVFNTALNQHRDHHRKAFRDLS